MRILNIERNKNPDANDKLRRKESSMYNKKDFPDTHRGHSTADNWTKHTNQTKRNAKGQCTWS